MMKKKEGRLLIQWGILRVANGEKVLSLSTNQSNTVASQE